MYRKNPHIEKYLEFMQLRRRAIPKSNSDTVALFELHMDYPTHIAYGETAIFLRKKGIRPIGYKPIHDLTLRGHLSLYLQRIFRIDKGQNWPFHVFRGIGIESFVIPPIGISYMNLGSRVWKSPRFSSKDEVLDYKISDVHVGDLFYDWHMNIRHLGTVDLKSKEFRDDFVKFIKTFHFWEKYFRNNKVHSVFVSHTCYGQGLLTRIAIKNGVHSLQVTGDRMYRMSSSHLRADSEFDYYDPKKQNLFEYQISIERAKKKVAELRLGKVGVDASHAQVSGYMGKSNVQVIEKSNNQKVLIVAHCFSDSPNGFGIQLFPDYFEWLQEVLNASKNVDVDWYIRPHPGFVYNDERIFNELLYRYPHVRNVGLDNSIPALINQGINTVLTSHGTVGFEAALEGAYVIGASERAFYRNYSFVHIPKSRAEWREAILNLNLQTRSLYDLNDVYHYYDIHHLRSETSWLLRDHYTNFLKKVGGLRRQFTNPEVFTTWLELCAKDEDLNTNQNILSEFLSSGKYFYKYGSEM